MKVPFSPNNQESSKSLSSTAVSANRNPQTGSPYEPKSVLDLRQSPTRAADQKLNSNACDKILGAVCDDSLKLDHDHASINHQFDDWDSLMKELGLHDDSKPVITPQPDSESTQDHYSNIPEFSPVATFDSVQFVPADFGPVSDIPNHPAGDLNAGWTVGFDYIDELIRLAECFDTNSIQLGQVILARLNQRLRSPIGKPLQRAAFFFKEALQSLLTGAIPINRSSDIVQIIKAEKAFSSISPITMYSSFTANQAVLDSLEDSVHVHIIDFDIGLGSHWASFMRELADKSDLSKANLPVLRISAVVLDDYAVESRLIRENLTQFACELNVRFEIDFVLMRTFEFMSFKSFKFMESERVAVVLSSAIFRRIGAGFLNDLRRISPHVVVHVDADGLMACGSSTYRQTVIDGLEFYSTIMESLEAANFNNSGGGGGADWIRRIETFVLFPKILEAMDGSVRRAPPPREALVAAGLRPVGLSRFANFQAECLLRRVQVRGFHVAKRQAEMLLCWHDRPLVATSAWKY